MKIIKKHLLQPYSALPFSHPDVQEIPKIRPQTLLLSLLLNPPYPPLNLLIPARQKIRLSQKTALSDSQNSQESDQSVSESSNNDTPDPKANESESSELYAMDTVMSLTAYGSHAREALDSASAEIQRLDQLFSISSKTGDIYRVNRDGQGDLSEDTRSLLASALEYGQGHQRYF